MSDYEEAVVAGLISLKGEKFPLALEVERSTQTLKQCF